MDIIRKKPILTAPKKKAISIVKPHKKRKWTNDFLYCIIL
jgi:hypothetical protein